MPVYPGDTEFAVIRAVDAKYMSVSGDMTMFPQTPGKWHYTSRIGAGSLGSVRNRRNEREMPRCASTASREVPEPGKPSRRIDFFAADGTPVSHAGELLFRSREEPSSFLKNSINFDKFTGFFGKFHP